MELAAPWCLASVTKNVSAVAVTGKQPWQSPEAARGQHHRLQRASALLWGLFSVSIRGSDAGAHKPVRDRRGTQPDTSLTWK